MLQDLDVARVSAAEGQAPVATSTQIVHVRRSLLSYLRRDGERKGDHCGPSRS